MSGSFRATPPVTAVSWPALPPSRAYILSKTSSGPSTPVPWLCTQRTSSERRIGNPPRQTNFPGGRVRKCRQREQLPRCGFELNGSQHTVLFLNNASLPVVQGSRRPPVFSRAVPAIMFAHFTPVAQPTRRRYQISRTPRSTNLSILFRADISDRAPRRRRRCFGSSTLLLSLWISS